jgi:hypothetical protein
MDINTRVDVGLTPPAGAKLTGMKHQRVSELAKRLQDVEAYRNHLLGAMYFAAYLKIPPPRGTFGTGENERFTPEPYIAHQELA